MSRTVRKEKMKMDKINWKRKLTSRKFWAAIIGFITTLLVAFNVPTLKVEQVIAIISSVSVLVAYIIGEGLVDSTRDKESKKDENAAQ